MMYIKDYLFNKNTIIFYSNISTILFQNGRKGLEVSPYYCVSDIRSSLRSFLASTWHVHLIHQLCHENDTAGLRALLDSRSDLDSVSELLSLRNDRGWTALHVAVIMNRVEVIKVLVSLGADFLASINAQGKYSIILYHIIKTNYCVTRFFWTNCT